MIWTKKTFIAALVSFLGGIAFFPTPAQAEDQEYYLRLTGSAAANCQFSSYQVGRIIAVGKDLGTVGSTGIAANNDLADNADFYLNDASPARVTIECNANTLIYVWSPTIVSSPPGFSPVEARSILKDGADNNIQTVAITNTPTIPVKSESGINHAAADIVDYEVDVNIRSLSGIPVGDYEYEVRLTIAPL